MRIPLTRALISVSDKNNVDVLARALVNVGCEVISTGSTARALAEAGIPVKDVSEVTGFPECLTGRVKTLHPAIHAGILADRARPEHMNFLEEEEIAPIDLVVANFYPFTHTVASGASLAHCIENIDIGGPAMVRAAAKNYASVTVLTNPCDYPAAIEAIERGGFEDAERAELAARAFAATAAYEAQVAMWTAEHMGTSGSLRIEIYRESRTLRYGENPHQRARLYLREEECRGARGDEAETNFSTNMDGGESGSKGRKGQWGIARARQLRGGEMSYNNYRDADAALRAAFDHEDPAVAIIKHMNPCGIATAPTIAQAHALAHACDPLSAYGGVIAANRDISLDMAQQISPIFTEVVVAPGYEPGALEILERKRKLRILEVCGDESGSQAERIGGGLLVQSRDRYDAPGDDPASWRHVAGPVVDRATMQELAFAWRCVRAVKSNAIVLTSGGATVGIGMGQVNRVDACRLAVQRARTLAEGVERVRTAVAASDAFFPFPDGLEILAEAGVRAVVEPGGSIRDDEVIAAAERAGVALFFTGARHFFH